MTDTLVALLAEGVDRNKDLDTETLKWMESPSSRRAWIEICKNFAAPMA